MNGDDDVAIEGHIVLRQEEALHLPKGEEGSDKLVVPLLHRFDLALAVGTAARHFCCKGDEEDAELAVLAGIFVDVFVYSLNFLRKLPSNASIWA